VEEEEEEAEDADPPHPHRTLQHSNLSVRPHLPVHPALPSLFPPIGAYPTRSRRHYPTTPQDDRKRGRGPRAERSLQSLPTSNGTEPPNATSPYTAALAMVHYHTPEFAGSIATLRNGQAPSGCKEQAKGSKRCSASAVVIAKKRWGHCANRCICRLTTTTHYAHPREEGAGRGGGGEEAERRGRLVSSPFLTISCVKTMPTPSQSTVWGTNTAPWPPPLSLAARVIHTQLYPHAPCRRLLQRTDCSQTVLPPVP
jgi:hypothetical protein